MHLTEGIIRTRPDSCKRCYSCIRECPAKAIRVVNGQALIMEERCIACGHCVKVCSQNAKEISSFTSEELRKLTSENKAVAIVAPSFAASWPNEYWKIPTALRALGFEKVIETAFGADLISPVYVHDIETSDIQTIISSSCPAVCNYIEKYYPELVPNLAKIVSPMVAVARYIKATLGQEYKIVFFGPCTAKKAEILSSSVDGILDEALTFVELKHILQECNISLDILEESRFDPPHANMGKSYPLAGGLIKTADLSGDVLEKKIIVVEGKSKVLEIIDEIMNNQINAKFIDILFCEGCISGPAIDSSLNYYSRREKVIEFIDESINEVDKKVWQSEVYNSRDLNLRIEHSVKDQRRAVPPEEEIQRILADINKPNEEDKLNCGACGYLTCEEFAISVAKGLAEKAMCLPYLIDELQVAYENLATTQEALHSAEKLASIGQLAAGIAHEINNPLGTIMLYASLIKKQVEKLEEGAQYDGDLKIIINEANRCKNIVANLLNFARQGKLTLQKFDLFDLIASIVKKIKLLPAMQGVLVEMHHAALDSTIEADKDQVEQVFLNMFMNAAEAMEQCSVKKLSITIDDSNGDMMITVADTGCGIAKENYGKIFTPFFTTKKIGKGTGLGMAIAYGIIKMHKGDIRFESEIDKGTTFHLKFPKTLTQTFN